MTDVDQRWSALSASVAAAGENPRSAGIAEWLKTRWFPLTVAIQCVLVVAVAIGWFAIPQQAEPFRALGAPPTAGAVSANALVVFRPSASEAEMRAALRAHNAQLVGGPTVADAYLLHLPELSDRALASLREEASVLRVDSLESGAR